MKISVVVPTFKRPALLLRCLQALLMQRLDHRLYEIVVVTDGTDSLTAHAVDVWLTEQEVRTGGAIPELTLIQMSAKRGPAAARNVGWTNAAAELIAFTDDDTIPDPGWLEAWCDAAGDPSGTGLRFLAFSGRTIVPLGPDPTDYELNTFGLEAGEFITANCCCSKAALQLVAGFDERFRTAWREDSDLHFKFLREQVPVSRIREAIVVHPVRPARWGVSLREQRKGMFNALLCKKHPVLYRDRIQRAPLWNYYAMFLLLPAGLLLLAGGYALAGLLSIGCWGFLFAKFLIRRLKYSSHRPGHVAEMALTSAVIPFLSVYWQLYGSVKFRKLVL